MANPSKKIREQRDDLSPFLFHYTKGREAFEILLSIIDEKKLKSEKGYICFTEAPLATSLRMFDYMNQKDIDFWGMTEFHEVPFDPFGTIKYGYIPKHIQSYFMVFRKSLVSNKFVILFLVTIC